MLQWLLRDRSDLARRVGALETALAKLQATELERESVTADQVDQLTRLWKRFRQREVVDKKRGDAPPDDGLDEVTRMIHRRRGLLRPLSNDNGDQ